MWQPMNTAPRDGTEILVLTADGAYAMVYEVGQWSHHYYDGDEREPDSWCAVDLDGYVTDNLIIQSDAWYDPEDKNGNTVIYYDNQALGWMPMPENTEEFRTKNDHNQPTA